ncbi:putative transporter [Fonsecaea multimorphosa]|nr:putative transporter [Fonsecaea multimorphosa]
MPDVELDTSIIKLIRTAKSDNAATEIYNNVARAEGKYKALQLAVKHLVNALQWTGLDKTEKNLFLWWPEPDRFIDRGVTLDESWYTSGSWIPILQDSKNCAIFGLATWRWLEDHRTGKTCRNPDGSGDPKILCKKSELILYTGIGPHNKGEPLTVGQYLIMESRKPERHVFVVCGVV